MRSEIKHFAQTNFRLVPTIALCLFLALGASAQDIHSGFIPEGYTLIDGDMLLPTVYVDSVLRAQMLSPSTPQATFSPSLWALGTPPFQIPGVIPFQFNANVSAANQSLMISAMSVLENAANVDFQQCPNNSCNGPNSVQIVNSTANNSQVGMVGGQQFINITSWGSQFIIIHELLHCLGFFHEQSRPDRNTFVQINCANVQGGCNGNIYNSNFQFLGAALTFGNYDFDSLMHYDQCGFSIDCPAGATCACTNTVMTVLPPNQNQQTLIGQRNHLSSLDRATLSFLYPFDNWTLLDCTYNGNNGTPDGSLSRPYATLAAALANTPPGGTIWVLKNCSFPTGTYNNQVTVRAAPNVIATFGN